MAIRRVNLLLLFIASCFIIDIANAKWVELQKISVNKNENDSDNLLGAAATVNFLNSMNMAYIGPIQIGIPQQTFNVVYDTGSDILFVQVLGCQGCTYSSEPEIGYTPHFYNAKNSLSSNVSTQQATLYYGSLSATGYTGTETVWVDSNTYASGFNMLFANQEGASQSGYKSSCFDGIMGLSNKGSYTNIYQQGTKEGVLSTSLFAFDLGQSKFYYDDIPQEYTNAPKVPASMDDRWTFTILGLEVDGVDRTGDLAYNDALVDSGTSLIAIDPSILLQIVNNTPELKFSSIQAYAIPNCQGCTCLSTITTLPTFTFYSRGAKITLPPSDYMVQYQTYCVLGLQSNAQFGFVILGDSFMRSLVVTYDKGPNEMYFYGKNSIFMTNPNTFYAFIALSVFTGLWLILNTFLIYKASKTRETLFYDFNNPSSLNQRLLY